jgi:hypothetical protein
MQDDYVSLKIHPQARKELRVLKAQRGETYTETIQWLTDQANEDAEDSA